MVPIGYTIMRSLQDEREREFARAARENPCRGRRLAAWRFGWRRVSGCTMAIARQS